MHLHQGKIRTVYANASDAVMDVMSIASIHTMTTGIHVRSGRRPLMLVGAQAPFRLRESGYSVK